MTSESMAERKSVWNEISTDTSVKVARY